MPLMIAAGAVGIAGGIAGFFGGKKAAEDAEDAAELAAILRAQETKEKIRRATYEHEQVIGMAQGIQSASGLRAFGGSTELYVEELEKVFQEDIAWLKKSSASEQYQLKEQGESAANIATTQAWTSLAGGISSGLGAWGQI